jgi:hypothetical protein
MVKSPNVVNKHQNTFIREMLFQVYLDLWSMLVFIKKVVSKRFEWCWKREKVSCKKWYKKELV